MRNIVILSLFMLVFSECHAHAVVTKHSLSIEKIAPNQASSVSLNFNSKIELGLSQVFLVSKGDKLELLAIDNGPQQGQIKIAMPPLQPGDYALKLKVFAQDGHLTEDVIHFTVTP